MTSFARCDAMFVVLLSVLWICPLKVPRSSQSKMPPGFATMLCVHSPLYSNFQPSILYSPVCSLGSRVNLHSRYAEHDLSSLFGDVLDRARAECLPGSRVLSLSLGALSCHRLPLAVLSLRRDDVFFVLQRSLDSTRHPANIIGDSLKVGPCIYAPSMRSWFPRSFHIQCTITRMHFSCLFPRYFLVSRRTYFVALTSSARMLPSPWGNSQVH